MTRLNLGPGSLIKFFPCDQSLKLLPRYKLLKWGCGMAPRASLPSTRALCDHSVLQAGGSDFFQSTFSGAGNVPLARVCASWYISFDQNVAGNKWASERRSCLNIFPASNCRQINLLRGTATWQVIEWKLQLAALEDRIQNLRLLQASRRPDMPIERSDSHFSSYFYCSTWPLFPKDRGVTIKIASWTALNHRT